MDQTRLMNRILYLGDRLLKLEAALEQFRIGFSNVYFLHDTHYGDSPLYLFMRAERGRIRQELLDLEKEVQ